MRFHTRILLSKTLRQVLMSLFVVVLMVQGTAVGIFAVMGPAHVHKASTEPILEDFRRWKPPPEFREAAGPFAFHWHTHGSVLTQRHYHAFGDLSVIRTGDDGSDVDDGLSGTTAPAIVLAPLPNGLVWMPVPLEQMRASGRSWAFVTGFSNRIERPPQVA